MATPWSGGGPGKRWYLIRHWRTLGGVEVADTIRYWTADYARYALRRWRAALDAKAFGQWDDVELQVYDGRRWWLIEKLRGSEAGQIRSV